jgi:hypothetical protein
MRRPRLPRGSYSLKSHFLLFTGATYRASLSCAHTPHGAARAANPTCTRLVVAKYAPAAAAGIASHHAVMRPPPIWPEQDRLHRRTALFTTYDPFWRLAFALSRPLQILAHNLREPFATWTEPAFAKVSPRTKTNPAFRRQPCAHGAILPRLLERRLSPPDEPEDISEFSKRSLRHPLCSGNFAARTPTAFQIRLPLGPSYAGGSNRFCRNDRFRGDGGSPIKIKGF